ncbi:hypothetical protein J6590_094444 [Homalodisca vitripennis]|nr:hypothetical protein J6590_094444 [Homalodisca vitripennis]
MACHFPVESRYESFNVGLVRKKEFGTAPRLRELDQLYACPRGQTESSCLPLSQSVKSRQRDLLDPRHPELTIEGLTASNNCPGVALCESQWSSRLLVAINVIEFSIKLSDQRII